MRYLTALFSFLLILVVMSCQKDNPKELEAIFDQQLLEDKIQQFASFEKVEMQDIMSDKRKTSCSGINFQDALAAFVEANQQQANERCQIIKGPIEGCYEGFKAYAAALVFPKAGLCNEFNKNDKVK